MKTIKTLTKVTFGVAIIDFNNCIRKQQRSYQNQAMEKLPRKSEASWSHLLLLVSLLGMKTSVPWLPLLKAADLVGNFEFGGAFYCFCTNQ